MSTFKVGDVVSWMAFSGSNGRTMRFRTRRGRIKSIVGPMAYVKFANGRETHVLLTALDQPGEKTRLTQLAEGLADASRGKAEQS